MLKNKAELATGDPEICQGCKAIFNSLSKIEVKEAQVIGESDMQVWNCEFCNHANEVSMEKEEMPQTNTVSYIIEAAAQIQNKKDQGKKDVSIVFCMDQSGSMCVSKPINGQFQITND